MYTMTGSDTEEEMATTETFRFTITIEIALFATVSMLHHHLRCRPLLI